MSLETKSLDELRELAYRKRLVVNRLENELYDPDNADAIDEISQELLDAQNELIAIEKTLSAAEEKASATEASSELSQEEAASSEEPRPQESTEPRRVFRGAPRDTVRRAGSGTTRGLDTTGIEVTIDGYMEHLPTAFYHLLNREQNPLVVYTLVTNSRNTRRLRVISFIEGYTAKAVDTVELKRDQPQTISQLPTLFPQDVRGLNELTRAMLNIQVEDLDSGKIEEHRTVPIWLLARTTAPRQVRNAVTREPIDFARYLAAFVTPNEPSVMKFQRKVAERHLDKRLKGYRGDVEAQVAAIYKAVKEDLDIVYVHSKVSFDLDEGVRSQRIRLPRECIDGQMGNCIDATLLLASLLEGISLNPVIALVPGHAFVGWQTSEDGDDWAYLETTMLQTNEFREALDVGTSRAKSYQARFDATGDERWFQPLVISELRTKDRITPME